MNSWIEPVVSWLGEVYFLATVLLTAAGLAMMVSRQPARRLVVAKSALLALALLAPIAAGAGWVRSRRGGVDAPAGVIPPTVPSQNTLIICCAGSSITPIPPGPVAPGSRNPVDSPGPSSGPPGARLAAVLAAFAGGSGAMLAWLGLGAIASARLGDRARETPDRLRVLLARTVGEGGRPPRLIVCSKVAHPVAVGLIRPSIVLPSWFADGEPDRRIEAALAHEWAHIRNGDLWLLAASRLLLPLLFAHPMYAWLRRRIRADQEALADAEAAEGEGRIAYAEALLCWAGGRGGRDRNTLAPSLSLWERSSSLAGRMALLLDRDFRVEPTCPRCWRLGVGGVAVAVVVGLGVALINGPAVATPGPSRPAQRPFLGGHHTHPVAPSSPSPEGVTSGMLCPTEDGSDAGASRWPGRCRGG